MSEELINTALVHIKNELALSFNEDNSHSVFLHNYESELGGGRFMIWDIKKFVEPNDEFLKEFHNTLVMLKKYYNLVGGSLVLTWRNPTEARKILANGNQDISKGAFIRNVLDEGMDSIEVIEAEYLGQLKLKAEADRQLKMIKAVLTQNDETNRKTTDESTQRESLDSLATRENL
jgi:hypothetical protein